MSDHIVRLIAKGEDQASPAMQQAEGSLKSLGKAADLFTLTKLKRMAEKVMETGVEMAKLGAQSLAARDRLVAFAGGSANADAALDSLIASSDRTIDRFTATQQAARLMQMGVVESAQEMGIVGSIVGKLGDQTKSLEQRMQIFTMMMANQSRARLDTFGLSIEYVTRRQEELEAQGYSTQQAFKTAVYEDAEGALDQLGDTSDSVSVTFGRIEASLRNIQTIAAEAFAEAIEPTANWLATALEGGEALNRIISYQKELKEKGIISQSEIDAFLDFELALRQGGASAEEYRDALVGWVSTLQGVEAEYDQIMSAGTAALDAVVSRTIDLEAVNERLASSYLTVSAARRVLSERMADARRVEELADFARQAEDLERSHQQRMADIIASGQQSAAEIARAGYRERLDALNAAMQAELAALAASIEQRRYQESLENLERQHQKNIDRIRESATESEEERENRRFRQVMDNLEAEQQERLKALRAKYGKEEDFGSQKERLEEEHERRMMGLYTDSAREQERKRYEEALKELEYQEEEAELLEDFQEEKAGAEESHQAELDRIRQEAVQAQIDAENRRYNEAVAKMEQQRQQQIQDAAARRAIEDRYAAERQNLENQLNAQLAAIRAAEIQQRLAEENDAYARQQDSLQRSVDRAADTWYYTLQRRKLDYIDHLQSLESITQVEAERLLAMLLYPAGTTTPGHQGQPWEYQHGTDYHPGGLAIVGEKGPELLDLPRGTSVTPMSNLRDKGVSGGTVIQIFIGENAIRSDRDIYRTAEAIERSLRLRGVRTLQ